MPQVKIERAWWRPAAVISSAAVAIALTTVPKVALADEASVPAGNESAKQEQVIGTADEGIVSTPSATISAPVADGGPVDAGGASENNGGSGSNLVTDDSDEGVVEAPTSPNEDAAEQGGSGQEGPEAGTSVGDDGSAIDGSAGSDDSSEVSDIDGGASDNVEGDTDVIEDDVEGDAVDGVVEGDSEHSDELEDAANGSDSTMSNAPVSESGDLVQKQEEHLDGTFAISSGLDSSKVLDVPNGNTFNGQTVQIYDGNGGYPQMWEVAWHEDKDDEEGGYYTIGLKGSNYVLDVKDANAFDGATVWLYESNGTTAQKWSIVQREDGLWSVLSRLGNYCLDIKNASTANGNSLWLYSNNGTVAQGFDFLKYNPEIEGQKHIIDDGVYIIGSSGDASGKHVLDVDCASFDNSANIQLYENNGTVAQRFYFERVDEFYYVITNLGSGKVLELAGGGIVPSTNVQQYAHNNTDAQKWAIIESDVDGKYYLVNKLTGLALDVKWANYSNYTNVWGYTFDRSAAQQWTLIESDFVDDGEIYVIYSSADLSKVFDIKNGAPESGAHLQTYTSNNSLAQRFEVEIVGKNEFRIRTAASGGWLTASNGEIIQSGVKSDPVTTANTWRAIWKNGFFSLICGQDDNLALTIVDGMAVLRAVNERDAEYQHFIFRPAQLISDGYYEISSAVGNDMVLDVANGSFSNQANVQIYEKNDTNAQKFHIVWNGDGYVITVGRSDYALDAKNGGTTSGTNVWLYEQNGTKAQIWIAEIADRGGVVFINSLSGLALDVQGQGAVSGTNVQLYEKNGTVAQRWRLSATTVPYGWVQESGTWKYYDRNGNMLTDSIVAYNLYQQIKNQYSDTNYLIAVDAVQCHVVVFQGSAGNWELVFDALAGTGDPHLASTDTDGFGVTGEGGNPWGSLRGYFKLGSTTTGYTDSNGRRAYDSADQLKWFRSIYMDYGFHSTCGNYSDPSQVGKRISHGCIRMLEYYAKFIYDLPTYTMVAVLPSYNGDFQVDQR